MIIKTATKHFPFVIYSTEYIFRFGWGRFRQLFSHQPGSSAKPSLLFDGSQSTTLRQPIFSCHQYTQSLTSYSDWGQYLFDTRGPARSSTQQPWQQIWETGYPDQRQCLFCPFQRLKLCHPSWYHQLRFWNPLKPAKQLASAQGEG